jgi:DNA polymerase-3 subunit delta
MYGRTNADYFHILEYFNDFSNSDNLCYNSTVIMTLTGENTFAIAAAERQLAAAFTSKHGAHGVERVEAEDLTPARLPDLFQGATLFAPARLVIIRNLGANKPMLESLTEALAHAADDTTVVVADAALDKRTKLYKFLKANSSFKEFSPLGDAQLASWLQGEATRLGGALGAREARHLIDRAGRDQWRLANELDKLVSFAPEVTAGAIDQLVDATPEGTAFELLDAALAGNRPQLQQLFASLKTQEDPYKLFGLLASQVHALAVVATAGARSPDAIAKDAGLHPFVVRKTQAVASRLGVTRVAQIAADVARCDLQLKSTSADPWDVLQLCLQKIAVIKSAA